LAAAVILIGFAILLTKSSHDFVTWVLKRNKLLGAISTFLQHFGVVFSFRSIERPALWSLAGLIFSITIVYVLAWSMKLPMTYWQCLIVVPVVFLCISLPISFAGWGVREGAMVYMLGTMGISASNALALSVIFGLLSIVVSSLGGWAWLMTRNSNGKISAPTQE